MLDSQAVKNTSTAVSKGFHHLDSRVRAAKKHTAQTPLFLVHLLTQVTYLHQFLQRYLLQLHPLLLAIQYLPYLWPLCYQ